MVIEGSENLNEPNVKETKLKLKVGLPDAVRLACQTHVGGNLKVERMLKDASDFSEVIQTIKTNPVKFNLKPLGQEKHLVMFFLDIRNFTSFVETHPPFDVIYAIRKIFTSFSEIIVRNHGKVIETAGDEIYAVFGMSPLSKASADNAIIAGQEILDALDHLNDTYRLILQTKIQVGIGIHSGTVVFGEITLGGSTKISTVGLAINIASRIQKYTRKLNNSILVSHASFTESINQNWCRYSFQFDFCRIIIY